MKNEIFDNMLSRYDLTTEQHKRNAIFEVNQQMILAGLYAGGFFESAAFYGGTCLRIFHGLQRFSEDMDFSLLAQDDKFDFSKYFPAIIDAFAMVGREVEIKKKDKKNFGKVESAFLKDNTDVYDVTFTLGVYHISGEADNGTGFYVAPGGEPSTKNGSGRRIPDGTYPIINPTAGSQWIKPGVGGNVSKRGIRFHYGGTNPRSWTEGCFVLSSGYSVNGNTIHYNADESKTASRNFDNALGAIGHFSYRPKNRTYNREGATFNAPIKHTLILKSRKK